MKLKKVLKVLLWVLLGLGVLVGLFFLFLYIMVSGCETVGKGLGF